MGKRSSTKVRRRISRTTGAPAGPPGSRSSSTAPGRCTPAPSWRGCARCSAATTPASRETIISGEILATAAFTLLSLLAALATYRASCALMPAQRLDSSPTVPPDALARSHREAQSYLPLLIFVPMLPTLYPMAAPVETQTWMLSVPFLAQNQRILRILRGEPVAGREWALSLGAGLALVALAWWLAARLYLREQLAASS